MSDLEQAVEDYLEIRRALGFKLQRHGKSLPRFVAFLTDQGAPYITNELALAWAKESPDADPIVWSNRLTLVRGFAKYLACHDSRTEVPPPGLLARPRHKYRAVPYVYSDADIESLMAAARSLRPLPALTFETLIGLLAISGLRIGESMRLARSDVDVEHGVLVVRDSKFNKSRAVPLHQSTLEALDSYLRRRDGLFPAPTSSTLFISTVGTQLTYNSVQPVFARLVRRAGLKARSAQCRPRLHDLRHSVAIRQLLEWHRSGADVGALLPRLSTLLGHVNPSSTYWYLEAVPELLALAAQRADHQMEVLS